MKKTDIAMVILIAITSVLISFFIAQSIFGESAQGSTTVKTADRIESDIFLPSEDIFNENAINPAVPVQIDGTDGT